MLAQIDNIYFLFDFIVINIAPVTNACLQITVTLKRLFLAIANIVIDCRNDIVKLLFRNMTLKLNMFIVCKQLSVGTKV